MADIWPDIPPALVDYLKKTFPPRCKSVTEPIEAHMLYAGKVALIQRLAFECERQQSAKYSLEEAVEGDDETTAVEIP